MGEHVWIPKFHTVQLITKKDNCNIHQKLPENLKKGIHTCALCIFSHKNAQ